ncbi:MAG: hypothetical protein JW709_00415 [Sedimentisphaerales bacterium]|nr:hypothetical protein [Sedimentisphaerales bacterium]
MGANDRQHRQHPRIGFLLERIKHSNIQITRDQAELARILGVPSAAVRWPTDLSQLVDPVPCLLVGGILGKRSDNIQRTLQRNGFAVAKARGRWYCQAEDAANLWPRFQRYRQKTMES